MEAPITSMEATTRFHGSSGIFRGSSFHLNPLKEPIMHQTQVPLLLMILSITAVAELSTAAAAAGHTRPGSASLSAQLVGLTLEPLPFVIDFVVCFLVRNSKFGII